jgi:opacity protein-like surface antigen
MRERLLKASIFVICFWSIILAFSALNLYSQEEKARVIKEEAVLRLDPNKESPAIKNLPLGAMLEIEETVGEWLKVKLPPDERGFVITGYVHKSDVAFEIIPAPAKPPEKIEEEVVEEKPRVAPVPPPKVVIKEKGEKRPAIGLGVFAGYAMPSESIYGGGVMFGGRLCFSITRNIGIELKGLMFQSTVKDPEGLKLSDGKLSLIPLQVSLQGRFPVGEKFVPYLGAGLGYYISSFEIDSEISDDWNALGFDIEEKVESALAYHISLGIDYFFTSNLALNAEVIYTLADSEGSWSITDQVSGTQASGVIEETDFDNFMVGIGLKYYF